VRVIRIVSVISKGSVVALV